MLVFLVNDYGKDLLCIFFLITFPFPIINLYHTVHLAFLWTISHQQDDNKLDWVYDGCETHDCCRSEITCVLLLLPRTAEQFEAVHRKWTFWITWSKNIGLEVCLSFWSSLQSIKRQNWYFLAYVKNGRIVSELIISYGYIEVLLY